jgi:tRNA dimethylallyltransferase
LGRGKVPVIVGGTNYYIESILWKVLLGKNSEGESESGLIRKRKAEEESETGVRNANNGTSASFDNQFVDQPILRFMEDRKGEFKDSDLSNITNQELYTALHMVDPERTTKLHPNDRRKILRSLQVRFQSGRKHSELIAEQCAPLAHENGNGSGSDAVEMENEQNSGSECNKKVKTTSLGGPLRFPACCCLWIKVDKPILNERIDQRVDEMIVRGLKKELDDYMDVLRAEQRYSFNSEAYYYQLFVLNDIFVNS